MSHTLHVSPDLARQSAANSTSSHPPAFPTSSNDECSVNVEKQTSSVQRWSKIRMALHFTVRTKKLTLAKPTHLMEGLSAQRRKLLVGGIISAMLGCGVISAETKAATFHSSAIGRWGTGQPYSFPYVWSITLLTFLGKVSLLALCGKRGKKDQHEHDKPCPVECDAGPSSASIHREQSVELPDDSVTWVQLLSPLCVLILIAFCDMLGSTLSSQALAIGVQTSIFVVFKSAKIVFVALASWSILGNYIAKPQWAALALLSMAMSIAAFAEGKTCKRCAVMSFEGPILLLLGEFCHAVQIVLQELCMKKFFLSPGLVVGGSSVFGTICAALACWRARLTIVPLVGLNGENLGSRPADDIVDVITMMHDNSFLCAMIILHLVAIALNDFCSVSVAKHVNSIARVLVDALKLCAMWIMGKFFFWISVLPSLQEPWHPMGPPPLFLGSWMMIPAMLFISYGLLMYQKSVWLPVKYSFSTGWTVQSGKITDKKERVQRPSAPSAVLRYSDIGADASPLLSDDARSLGSPRYLGSLESPGSPGSPRSPRSPGLPGLPGSPVMPTPKWLTKQVTRLGLDDNLYVAPFRDEKEVSALVAAVSRERIIPTHARFAPISAQDYMNQMLIKVGRKSGTWSAASVGHRQSVEDVRASQVSLKFRRFSTTLN